MLYAAAALSALDVALSLNVLIPDFSTPHSVFIYFDLIPSVLHS